ncbi:MAG: kynureninase [Lutimonas sp.]
MKYSNTLEFALEMDGKDPLRDRKKQFLNPKTTDGKDCIYFCGNSLGLQPRSARSLVERIMKDWETRAVEGHFEGDEPWVPYHERLAPAMSRIVGAKEEEVILMNSLTVNLHLMMVSFYRPVPGRSKILIEKNAFPSDQYAVKSQIEFHGFDVEDNLLELEPRPGETLLRTEDIVKTIERKGEEIALIMMGGLNYYTGQVYDMKRITKAGHSKGCTVGFDLAHAVGNAPLNLHDWDVDFAVWCTYKYLNSGPGGIAGAFVHERHHKDENLPRFAGWWGHDKENRFLMDENFVPIPTAEGWQLSCGPILLEASFRASLEMFDEVGMEELRRKSELLTGYLEFLIGRIQSDKIEIITPSDPAERGCQLSVRVIGSDKSLFHALHDKGIITDWREPDVIRVAPTPMYNSFEEVFRFVAILKDCLNLV